MPGLTDNRAARDAILARVRKALGKSGDRAQARADAEAYVAEHNHGPRPSMPEDVVGRFVKRATDMESTVERLSDLTELPAVVARYLGGLQLPAALAEQKSLKGVCWPEFANLDWAGAGLAIEGRPITGSDRLGITGCFCAIAETGTLVVLSGPETPTGTAILPDTHVAVVHADRVVPGMEEAFALIRAERGKPPRAINMISGPSRTADIEQTLVVGAHGPFRVHIVLIG